MFIFSESSRPPSTEQACQTFLEWTIKTDCTVCESLREAIVPRITCQVRMVRNDQEFTAMMWIKKRQDTVSEVSARPSLVGLIPSPSYSYSHTHTHTHTPPPRTAAWFSDPTSTALIFSLVFSPPDKQIFPSSSPRCLIKYVTLFKHLTP